MELSKRLRGIAGLVEEGASVADIGTDHGYLPIWLMENRIAKRVIAMDVNEGPLARAREQIENGGPGEKKGQIETRLSDGFSGLLPGEADTAVVAGMGGRLMMKILEEGRHVTGALSVLILQPQACVPDVRRYISGHGMRIEKEDMVFEDGKYYPMMRVVHGEEEPYEEWEYRYGKRLLEQRHPVLKEYLLWEMAAREQILEKLQTGRTGKASRRREEIKAEIMLAERALACYGPENQS